jgi:Methane oxygenase PmoA
MARGMSTRHLFVLFFVALAGTTGLSAGRPEEIVELRRDGSHVDVLIGGRPFTTYYFDLAVAKPYFFPLRSAQGTVVTRGFPMTAAIPGEDHDEPHQRGMYFAHGDINGFDFWGEAAYPRWSDHPVSTFGRTVFRALDEIRGGSGDGVFGPRSTSSRRPAPSPRRRRHSTSVVTTTRGRSIASLRFMPATLRSRWVTPRRARLPSASSRHWIRHLAEW